MDGDAVAHARPHGAPGAARRRSRRHGGLAGAIPWILPAVAFLAVVYGYGVYRLIVEATHRKGKPVGLENIRLVLDDPLFKTAVVHNLRLLGALPVLIVLALLLAILLFEGVRGWRFHRFVLFLPYVLPIPVIGIIFVQLLTLNGVINQILRAVGLGALAQDWLGQPRWALWSIGAVIVWKELGFGIVLFLSRLLALPADVFEAAKVDGAGFWRMHWHVTTPMLAPIIVFYGVIEGITLLSWVFNYVWSMTRGGPGDSTQVAETYIYQSATTYNAPFLAASAATILLVGVLGMMVISVVVRSRAEGEEAA